MSTKITTFLGEGLLVNVEFDYSAAEPEVLYPNEEAHPGSDEEVNIISVERDFVDIYDCLSRGCIKELEISVVEWVRAQEEDDE